MSNKSSSFSSLSHILVLTGSTDYARWSLAIKNVAMMADIWEYLDGTETYPAPVDIKAVTADETAAIKVWKKANSKALGLMESTCTEELQLHIDEYRVTTTTTAGVTTTTTVGVTTTTTAGVTTTSADPPTATEVWSHLATKYKKKDGVTAAMDWGNLIEDQFKSDVRMEEQIASHLSRRSKIALSGFTFPDWQFALLILLCLCHRTLFLLVFFVHFRPNFTSHSLPHTFLPYAYFDYVHFPL